MTNVIDKLRGLLLSAAVTPLHACSPHPEVEVAVTDSEAPAGKNPAEQGDMAEGEMDTEPADDDGTVCRVSCVHVP
jgi:hypothetical protein